MVITFGQALVVSNSVCTSLKCAMSGTCMIKGNESFHLIEFMLGNVKILGITFLNDNAVSGNVSLALFLYASFINVRFELCMELTF